jgi:hypothetical protein
MNILKKAQYETNLKRSRKNTKAATVSKERAMQAEGINKTA